MCGRVAYRLVAEVAEEKICLCDRCIPNCVIYKKNDGLMVIKQGK
jgi:hypothetical protein